MEAPDDDTVMNLVELALARSPEEREAYVRAACGNESELATQVMDYVYWEERMNGFLLDPLCPPIFYEHPVEAGDLLDGRFHIVREIAQGGMGIVYEATDEKLERRIALKCGKAGYHKRLPPEVRNATAISHPNVCKIFEIHTAVTRLGEIDFLTMEFLDGETLAERLRRSPVPQAAAREIGLQICAGLAAAHRNQVVHGDLKSGNVILTTGPEGAPRAVITDFGLAHQPGAGSFAAQSGIQGGTPSYMAPELWKGEKHSAASDVYALGVILYELAFGRQPWAPGTSWEDRLSRRPPTAGSAWSGVLVRCLDPDPRKRFADAQEAERALAPTRFRLWFTAAAAAVVLAAATGIATYRSALPRETVKLAVVPFETDPGVAGVPDDIFRNTVDRLAGLKGGAQIRFSVIPWKKIEAEHAGSPERAQTLFGATHVLHGSFSMQNGHITVHATVTDMPNRVDLKAWEAAYMPREIGFAPGALAGVVTSALHLPPPAESAQVNKRARADFQRGVAAGRFDSGVDAALTSLRRAVEEDPDSPLTHARLAEAEWFKYYLAGDAKWLAQATESLRQAELRNPDSAAVLRVRGVLDANRGLYESAEAEYRRAIELEPANGDGYRRLGMVLDQNGRTDEALAEYRKALKADPDYYRTYQALGALYIDRGDYGQAAAWFAKTVSLAPKEPNAHYALGVAYMNLGRFAEAGNELLTSVRLQETMAALEALGLALMYQSKEREAVPYFERALRQGPEHYLVWSNLGVAYQRLNRNSESARANRRALALTEEEIKKDPRDGQVRSELALECARLGYRARAESEIEQALELSPNNADTLWAAAVTYETLHERSRTLGVLSAAPAGVLAEVGHWPEVAGLRQDPRFLKLLASHQLK